MKLKSPFAGGGRFQAGWVLNNVLVHL